MSLSAGYRLGPYEIVAPLGAGGMGEVYKARDTRLGRDVAIKVSAQQFSERFEREARVIASLNHPNICTLYDVGPNYLVMELIEGESPKGPLPLNEVLNYGRQIAIALEAAHEKGVTHRDLKPANVKITPNGTVKVLDFGLAKILAPEEGSGEKSQSPTMSMAATRAGVILGTAAYMAPEQARGKPVDKRADIWAFGCVLYELLTGKSPFEGETVMDILGAVVNREPDWSALPPGSPVRTLQRCMEKDAKRRWRDISDVSLEAESLPVTVTVARPAWQHPLVWALALIAIASLAFALWNRAGSIPKAVVRLSIPLPPGQEITDYPAISPDGQTIAYAARQGTEEAQLYIRSLNSFEAKAVAGSSGSRHQPFFSPDGKWVAFFAQNQLQKAEVAGGSPVKIADAPLPFGGSWNDDDTIVFVSGLNSGLLRVPAGGGKPESLTKPDGAGKGYAHTFPQWLPGGRKVLFSVWGQNPGTAVLSLDSHQWQLVAPVTQSGYSGAIFAGAVGSTGHLLNVDESAGIRAASFDANKGQPANTQTSVLANVYYAEEDGRAWLAASKTGTAAYAPGNPGKRSLAWVDRDGKVELIGKNEDIYAEAALSPDGSKAAARHLADLWIHDLQRGTQTRLTLPNSGGNFQPLWSRDSKTVLFASNRGGDWDIYSQPADGSRPAEVLLKRPYDQFPLSIASDGTLLYQEVHPITGMDLWARSPDGKTSPVRVTPFEEGYGDFSPDGRWLAFESNESGRNEIYLQSYPGGGNRIPVSTGGGQAPRWSHDGKELFYVTGDAVVAVAVQQDGSVGASSRRLFDRSGFLFNLFHDYDVSPDGKRFLMIRRDPGSVPRQLNVILNWSEELDRLVPAVKK